MKPAKGVLNKKQKICDDASTPAIKRFFKSAPKSFVINDKPNNHGETSSRDFYIQVLKEKLQENHATQADEAHEDLSQVNGLEANCTEGDGQENIAGGVDKTVDRIENVHSDGSKVPCPDCERNRKERIEMEEKYKELKKMYYKLAVHHSELDLKHKDLKALKTNENNIDLNVSLAAADSDIFTPNELKFLQCMPLEKQKDSTFVLQCLKFAYKQNTSVLYNKSLFGTKGRIEFTDDRKEVQHPAKEPLSPQKVERIRGVFIARISKCEINSVEYGLRIKETYLNQLFASAIKNITKQQQRDTN